MRTRGIKDFGVRPVLDDRAVNPIQSTPNRRLFGDGLDVWIGKSKDFSFMAVLSLCSSLSH